MANNLVINISSGFSVDQIKPFINSLKQSGYKGDTCMFVNRNDKNTIKYLTDNGVKVIKFNHKLFKIPFLNKKINLFALQNPKKKMTYLNHLLIRILIKYLDNKGSLFRKRRKKLLHKLIFKLTNVMLFRFILFYDYLQTHPYDNILIADSRDVIFQINPFDYSYDNFLYSFKEYEKNSIGKSPENLNWIEAAYSSSQISEELLLKTVICAGVTIGNYKRILSYLKALTDELIRVAPYIGASGGPDQGIHNYLLWNNKIKNVKILDNFYGPVLTLALEPDENIRINKDGYLINHDNSIINIIHQYDRNTRISKHLSNKYK